MEEKKMTWTHEDWRQATSRVLTEPASDFGKRCWTFFEKRSELIAIREQKCANDGETPEDFKTFYANLEALTEEYFGYLGIEAHCSNSWSFQNSCGVVCPQWARVLAEFLICAVEFAESTAEQAACEAFNRRWDELKDEDEADKMIDAGIEGDRAKDQALFVEKCRFAADATELMLKLQANIEYLPEVGKYL